MPIILPFLTRNIIVTRNFKRKNINYINLLLGSFIRGREQRNNFGHMMSASRTNYPFIIKSVSKQHLRGSNLEGKNCG
jgi:hypothetical protein